MHLISVSVVEPDPNTRGQIASLLQGQPGLQLAGSHATGDEATESIRLNLIEVVLIGYDGNGMDWVRSLNRDNPKIRCVVYGSFETDQQIFSCLRAGAGGCLLLPFGGEELAAAITEVCHGGAPLSRRIARSVVTYFNRQGRDYVNVSARERQVLELLAQGKSCKEIGECLGISAETVRKHLKKMYNKLGVHNRTEAVLKFLGHA